MKNGAEQLASADVRLEQISKKFGDLEVLRSVSLDVAPGSVTCILGPSGSGKSTLLRCINHLERLDQGRIFVGEQLMGYRRDSRGRLRELNSLELAKQRTSVGMVFQRFNLFAHKTALENIVEPNVLVLKKSREESRQIALDLLDRVGLVAHQDHYPYQLSGGQQQRVAIARALALEPKVMLFDEPTSALDPELVGDVLHVMKDLASTGMTMLVVTHEVGFAREVADEVVFMCDGIIEEQGQPAKVLSSPESQTFANFLGRVL